MNLEDKNLIGCTADEKDDHIIECHEMIRELKKAYRCEGLIEGLIDIGYEMHIHDIEGRYPDGLDREKYKKQKIDELLNTLLDIMGLTVKGEDILKLIFY